MARATTYPVLEYPGAGRAIIEPARLLGRHRRIPSRCVLCFFGEVIRRQARAGRLCRVQRLTGEGDPIPVYALGAGKQAVAVVWPGMGAPFVAAVLEELIALGGREFIACGGAGVLDGSIAPGQVIVPTSAVRDEGTSFHYQRAGRVNRPHTRAVAAIRQACRARGVAFLQGRTWTTDGVYRETPRQIRRRRAEGCITVEMEAAAFFAVARFRRVRFGQLLYAGDDVSGKVWAPRRWTRLRTVRERLFWLAVDACRRVGG